MAYIDDGEGPKHWLLYDSRIGVFWKPGGCGYTCDVAQAGLFSRAFVDRFTGPSYAERGERARHLREFRYILNEARKQLHALEERFALLDRDSVEADITTAG